jgi:acetyl esterase/lipase
MRSIYIFFCLALAAVSPPALSQRVIPIWGEDEPLYSKVHTLEEYEAPCGQATCAYQVVTPTLTLYTARSQGAGEGTGNVVVVLPGGGYESEAVYYEGFEIAQALAERGTTAAALKYRLPNPETARHPEKVPLSDVRQALHLLRTRQTDYQFSASRYGVLGFSAGSHLATVASVRRSAQATENPDFSILIYGVSRLSPENLQWLEESLYHRKLTDAEIADETLLEHVDANTPPAFLVHALDDDVCHFTESTLYAEALTRHGVDAELHLFARGGHGFGAGRDHDGTGQWLDLAADWLDRLGAQVEN